MSECHDLTKKKSNTTWYIIANAFGLFFSALVLESDFKHNISKPYGMLFLIGAAIVSIVMFIIEKYSYVTITIESFFTLVGIGLLVYYLKFNNNNIIYLWCSLGSFVIANIFAIVMFSIELDKLNKTKCNYV